jgi:hypothetical protein
MPGTNFLVLLGLAVYLVASLLLWRLLLREPSPMDARRTPPRWPLRLAKALATFVGGAATGAVALLIVTTLVNAGRPGTMTTEVMLGVWVVAAVATMLFIGRAPLIRRVVIRTCLALGVQGVILPLATLVAFAVAGTRLAGSAGTAGERTVEVLGIRLVGNLPAIWIALAGFVVGLVLVAVSDRARRRAAGRRARRQGRASRAGVMSVRARR